MSDYRIFVEKLPQFQVEAKSIQSDLNLNLGLNQKNLRLVNVYDLFGFNDDLLEKSRYQVFGEIVTDTVFDELNLEGKKYVAIEYLPGQFDQRASSAIDCVKLIDPNADINIRSGRIIILDDDTTDEDYRQLLDKKRQYLETNTRLEENIKKIQKTLNQKYNSVSDVVQENTNRLDLLKSRNELLQKEINNLTTVYQLTIEQERIKYELKQKENKIEKEKNNKIVNQFDTSSVTEKTILNALKESNDLPKKNKNKSGYVIEKHSENKVDNETREEKLQKIKLKYKNMEDEPIDESDLKEEIKE